MDRLLYAGGLERELSATHSGIIETKDLTITLTNEKNLLTNQPVTQVVYNVVINNKIIGAITARIYTAAQGHKRIESLRYEGIKLNKISNGQEKIILIAVETPDYFSTLTNKILYVNTAKPNNTEQDPLYRTDDLQNINLADYEVSGTDHREAMKKKLRNIRGYEPDHIKM